MRLPLPYLCSLALGLSLVAVSAHAASAAKPKAAGTAATTPRSAPHAQTTPRTVEDVPLPQSPVPPFAQVDTNHDGKIEWPEAKAVGVPKKLFNHFDFDHNGSLTETEWLFLRLDMTHFAPTATTKAPPAATH